MKHDNIEIRFYKKSELAKLAGVSYSTFYRYIRSRHQQLAAMGISIYAKKIHFSVANYLANDYCFDLKKNL